MVFDCNFMEYKDKMFTGLRNLEVKKMDISMQWGSVNYFFFMDILGLRVTHLDIMFIMVNIRKAKINKKEKLMNSFLQSKSLK